MPVFEADVRVNICHANKTMAEKLIDMRKMSGTRSSFEIFQKLSWKPLSAYK